MCVLKQSQYNVASYNAAPLNGRSKSIDSYFN